MVKICTDIEQSKKLVELGLSQETADMSYRWCICKCVNGEPVEDWLIELGKPFDKCPDEQIPAWSLSALLELMPTTIFTSRIASHLEIIRGDNVWHIHYIVKDGTTPVIECFFNAPDLLGATYDTMYWLLENKKL